MPLVQQLQVFHAELERLVTMARGGDGRRQAGADPSEPVPLTIHNALHALLQQQYGEAWREGGDVGAAVYVEAQYAMAALADETLLNVDAREMKSWRELLLEKKLFDSHDAGDKLFAKIDALLGQRKPANGELARVYLIVLALGFRGRFRRSVEGDAAIEGYRRRLYQFIYGREPWATRGREHLVPQAYTATRVDRNPAQLPYLRPWITAIVLIVVAWLAISAAVWRWALNGVDPALRAISARAPLTQTAPDATPATASSGGTP